jgi:hypothetical protein
MPTDGDMPPSCIMFDPGCASAPFYLRLEVEGGVEHVELADANGPSMSLPAAVQACVREGHDPTHWARAGRSPDPIPASVARMPASAPRNRG